MLPINYYFRFAVVCCSRSQWTVLDFFSSHSFFFFGFNSLPLAYALLVWYLSCVWVCFFSLLSFTSCSAFAFMPCLDDVNSLVSFPRCGFAGLVSCVLCAMCVLSIHTHLYTFFIFIMSFLFVLLINFWMLMMKLNDLIQFY